jgi:hypothetical protein
MERHAIDESIGDRRVGDDPWARRTPRTPTLTILRLLVLPIIFAGIFTLLDTFNGLTKVGIIYGGIAGSALSLAFLLAGTRRRVIGVFAGFATGTLFGLPVIEPCTGAGFIIIGAVAGWLATAIFTGFPGSFRLIPKGSSPTEEPGEPRRQSDGHDRPVPDEDIVFLESWAD